MSVAAETVARLKSAVLCNLLAAGSSKRHMCRRLGGARACCCNSHPSPCYVTTILNKCVPLLSVPLRPAILPRRWNKGNKRTHQRLRRTRKKTRASRQGIAPPRRCASNRRPPVGRTGAPRCGAADPNDKTAHITAVTIRPASVNRLLRLHAVRPLYGREGGRDSRGLPYTRVISVTEKRRTAERIQTAASAAAAAAVIAQLLGLLGSAAGYGVHRRVLPYV